jgi:hypothetical protein
VAQVSKYRYLLNQYPETVQKEQFRIICHISKRTARYLLQSGLVPCVQSGKKTRNYTITAFNLASWLAARGAEVAYIEVNQNRHLQLLLNIYEAAPDGEHYTIDGIDCYLTNEPDKAYQFIIYDCGVMQTPTSIFRDAEHRLLCGSVLPYEIPVFHKALSECGSLEVRPVAICVPQEIQEYCTELFGEDVQIAAASHDLFAKQVNGQIYRPLVEKYIAGEKRL